MAFVVETYQVFGGWQNVWNETDGDTGETIPQVFATEQDAMSELTGMIEDMDAAGMEPDWDDYRIKETDPTP